MSIPIRVNLHRLLKEIEVLERRPQSTGGIVLYGSSTFTRWAREKWGHQEPSEALGTKDIVNCGFGSSTAEEQLYYYPRVIRPLAPRALVYVTFGNDWMYGYSPSDILSLQSRLLNWARHDFPGIRLYVLDAKMDSKHLGDRSGWQHTRDEYNALLRDYCGRHEDCTLIRTVDSPLFFKDPADAGDYDKVRTDLFVEDGVHFNAEGYELFGRFMKEQLRDVL